MSDALMSARNCGATTVDRNPNGSFSLGNPGRPKGARNRTTRAVEALLDWQSKALTQKAVDMALGGDTTALRLCLERIAPPRKDVPISFELPVIDNAQSASEAAQAVLSAVAQGEITPLEGTAVMGLIENYRRILETTDLECRLKALEGDQ